MPAPAGRLVARAPIIPLGGQTLRARAPSHSYHEGLMGTSRPPQRDTRLRTATSHLPPFHMVTRQSLLVIHTGSYHGPRSKSITCDFPAVELPSWHINLSAEQGPAVSYFPSPMPIPAIGAPEWKGRDKQEITQGFSKLPISSKAFIPITPLQAGSLAC